MGKKIVDVVVKPHNDKISRNTLGKAPETAFLLQKQKKNQRK